MKREHVKKSFDIDGYKFYQTEKGSYKKAKLCTSEKAQTVTLYEFMQAWDKHFDLYYA